MWTLSDEPVLPRPFFDAVLPQEREVYQPQYHRACTALDRGTFVREASVWAVEDGEPVGVALVVGGERLELLVGVREGWRRRGIGAGLVKEVCGRLQRDRSRTLTGVAVSSANTAAVRLLHTAGFVGEPTGNLRMRRPLHGTLPCSEIAPGYVLRTLEVGEELAYARLKSLCFPEGKPWTEEDFNREFLSASFDAYARIFVVESKHQLVGTASAWEIDYGDGIVGLVHWVGVDPAHRGQGLGETLNLRVLAELAALGYREAWLNTSRDRVAAVRLYERLGFIMHRELYTYTLIL